MSRHRKRNKNYRNPKSYTIILTTAFGFILGSFITLGLFYVFVVEFNIHLAIVQHGFIVAGFVFPISFAFSQHLQCLAFLVFPQLFSKRGRIAILSFTFGLTLTGPGANLMKNLEIANRSLLCVQNHMNRAMKDVLKILKQPYTVLKETVKNMAENLKNSLSRLKYALRVMVKTMLRICKIIISVCFNLPKYQISVSIIESSYNWINSKISFCSHKNGRPLKRCVKMIENTFADCSHTFGEDLCAPIKLGDLICLPLVPLDKFCEYKQMFVNTFVDDIKKRLYFFF